MFNSLLVLGTYIILRSQIHWLQLSGAQENRFNAYLVFLLTTYILYKIAVLLNRQNHHLVFHPLHVQFKKQKIPYSNIAKVSTRRNMLDKLFQTYTLCINKTKIKGLMREHLDQYLHTLIEAGQTNTLTNNERLE